MKTDPIASVTDLDSVLSTITSSRQATPFRRVTRFRDVACMVFPPENYAGGSRYSMRRLRHFISSDPEIMERMRRAGYDPSRQFLTARQLKVLSEYV